MSKIPPLPHTVTASEIAEFVYCGESWRLAQTGHRSANRPACDHGTAHHSRKAIAEAAAGDSIALGRLLVVIAMLALLAAYLCR